MSDIQQGDIYVANSLNGFEGLIGNWHEDEVEHVHSDHVHIRCLDGTDDRFLVPTPEFEALYTFVRRPE